MKYGIKGMLFILCIFLFASCSSEKQENYYRKVRLDGTYSIIGRFPVADELAKKIDCYRFVYNKDGELLGDKNNIAIRSYKYDEQRNLIEKSFYDTNQHLSEDKDGVAIYRSRYTNLEEI